MEFTGKIIAVLPERGGTSARTGNAWKVQEFVIEETTGQYPKKMVFEVFGEDRISRFNIKAGDVKHVMFDIDAREWNGRWFNSVRAYNVESVDPNSVAAAGPVPAMPPSYDAAPAPQGGSTEPFPPTQEAGAASTGSQDDLPF